MYILNDMIFIILFFIGIIFLFFRGDDPEIKKEDPLSPNTEIDSVSFTKPPIVHVGSPVLTGIRMNEIQPNIKPDETFDEHETESKDTTDARAETESRIEEYTEPESSITHMHSNDEDASTSVISIPEYATQCSKIHDLLETNTTRVNELGEKLLMCNEIHNL